MVCQIWVLIHTSTLIFKFQPKVHKAKPFYALVMDYFTLGGGRETSSQLFLFSVSLSLKTCQLSIYEETIFSNNARGSLC